MLISERRVFQAERTDSEKTKRQQCSWCVFLEKNQSQVFDFVLSSSLCSFFSRAISVSYSLSYISGHTIHTVLCFPIMINHEHSFMPLHLRSAPLFIKPEEYSIVETYQEFTL